VWGPNMYFAADYGGAFCLKTNDPVKEMQLQPMYSTVVGSFGGETKNWTRAALETTKRGKKHAVSVSFDTTLELVQQFRPDLRHGVLVLWKIPSDSAETGFDLVEAVVIGVRGGQLYRALLTGDAAAPFTNDELKTLRLATQEELQVTQQIKIGPGSFLDRTKEQAVALKLDQLFEYVDTTGSDAGLKLRPQQQFKCFSGFRTLCLFDQSEHLLKLFGVVPFEWVRVFVENTTKDAIIIGVREGCLWRVDFDRLGSLSCDLVLWPSRKGDEPLKALNRSNSTYPEASVFNHCAKHEELVKHYALAHVGTVSLRPFTG